MANITSVPSTILTATIQMRGSKLSKSGFIRRMRSARVVERFEIDKKERDDNKITRYNDILKQRYTFSKIENQKFKKQN